MARTASSTTTSPFTACKANPSETTDVNTQLLSQALVTGVLYGGIYVLIALGLELTFGVLGVFNIAHGDLLMLAMYSAFILSSQFGWGAYLTIPLTILLMFGLGCAFYALLLYPVRNRPETSQVLLTIGASVFLQNLASFLFSPDTRSIRPSNSDVRLQVGGVVASLNEIIPFTTAIIVVIILHWTLQNTHFGRCIRAAAENREAASIVGLDVRQLYTLVFGLSSALLGLAAALILPLYYVSPTVGSLFLVITFTIVVIGGMGSTVGVLISGILVGVTQSLASSVMSSSLATALLYCLLFAVLLLRPRGILGQYDYE